MSKVLIDSSVWINYFRQSDSIVVAQVNALLDDDRVALCGMVELEILQGLRGKELSTIKELFQALYFIDAIREDFVTAGLMLNQLRSTGITIPASDCLIAAQCLRCDLLIYTLDRDFDYIASLKKL